MTVGDINNPITLGKAFTGYRVIPGDTIFLRAGTYSANWINEIIGTSGNPVVVKPYDNERVIINGGFADAQAQYVTYVDIEFTTPRDPNPVVYSLDPSFDATGLGVKLINCTIHDSVGAAAWDNVDLVYGCISYNHGVIVDNVAYGHSLYTQNQDGSHKKTIKHCVFSRSANYGLHGYATDFSLTNIDIVENAFLPGSIHLIGSQKADDGILFDGNHVYGIVTLGYGAHEHTNLTVTNNIMCNLTGGVSFQTKKWLSGDVSGNTLVADGTGEQDLLVNINPTSPTTLAWDSNTYYNRTGKAACFHNDDDPLEPLPWKTLAQWRAAYGYDTHSTIALDGSSPVDTVTVYPNEYAGVSKRKGLVIIHNWSGASSVNVDLSTLSITGSTPYRLLQGQNPLNDVRAGTMPANHIISVSMSGIVASVSGWTDPPTTFPEFGCFVVESP